MWALKTPGWETRSGLCEHLTETQLGYPTHRLRVRMGHKRHREKKKGEGGGGGGGGGGEGEEGETKEII